jgi:DNA-binding NarL/FixJ family response regulator
VKGTSPLKTPRLRVFLADDHTIVRDGLRALLAAQPWVTVVGEAANGRAAVSQALSLRPDVMVMDIAMPELNGIDAAREIRAQLPGTQVVILSMHASTEHVVRALQAGAMGYLLKESAGREVLAAIQAVHAGRRYISQQSGETVIDELLSAAIPARTPLASLSQREREVLQLVAEGHSSADIGQRLSLSPKTIDTYRSRLMHKLGVSNLHGLIRFAIDNGLTPTWLPAKNRE